MSSIRNRRKSRFCLFLLLGTIVPTEAFPQGVREIAPGEFRSQLDNPWRDSPSVTVQLGEAEEAIRTIERGREYSQTYHFQIESWTSVSGDDPYAVDGGAAPNSIFTPVSQHGHFFPGDIVPFSMTGLYLGHSPSAFRWEKQFWVADDSTSDFETLPDRQVWQLEDDTIVVPVSVVVAHLPGREPYISLEDAKRLIDGVPSHKAERRTSPGGAIESYFVEIVAEPDVANFDRFRAVQRQWSPDDVFAQCGIQFRLASYVAVEVPEFIYFNDVKLLNLDPDELDTCAARFDHVRDNPDGFFNCGIPWDEYGFPPHVSCNGSIGGADDRVNGIKATLELAKPIAKKNFITGHTNPGTVPGLQLVFTGKIGSSAFAEVCSAVEDQPGLSDHQRWAAVSLSDMSSFPSTLAHEIGHVLLRSEVHSTGANDLMNRSGDLTHIRGCGTWGHTFPGVPLNCDATGDIGGQCTEMRAGTPILQSRLSPLDMRLRPSGLSGGQWSYGRYGETRTVDFTDLTSTEGEEAIVVPQGYVEIVSPSFRTADLPEVGDKMSVDIFVPETIDNPWWLGELHVTANIPSAGISDHWIAHTNLTNLPLGQWSTFEFELPMHVAMAFASDLPGAQMILATSATSEGVLIDNLRMAGNVQAQTAVHVEGSPPANVSLLPDGGFEELSAWTATNADLIFETQSVIDGSGALKIIPHGYTVVKSRQFSTDEFDSVSDQLSLDVYISDPQPNPWWVGEVQVYASCPSAGIYDNWVGYESLSNLFNGEFNQLVFSVPPAVRDAWEGSHHDCSVSLAINSNQDGVVILDRFGFL